MDTGIELKQVSQVLRWGYIRPEPRAGQVVEAASTVPQNPVTLDLAQVLECTSVNDLQSPIQACRRCPFGIQRTCSVSGSGQTSSPVLILGAIPGVEEDSLGMPFIGAAGQYLDTWLSSIELDRYRDAYLSYILKCRPADPDGFEARDAAPCLDWLDRQIQMLRPRAILLVGREAASILEANGRTGVSGDRGDVFTYGLVPCMCVEHPAAVLRNPVLRRDVWETLKVFRDILSRR